MGKGLSEGRPFFLWLNVNELSGREGKLYADMMADWKALLFASDLVGFRKET